MNLIPSRLRFFLCGTAMAGLSFTAMAQDLAEIDDPAAREAVSRIAAMLEDISSYTCNAEFSGAMLVGPQGGRRPAEFLTEAEIRFKRPAFGFRRQVTVKHPIEWKTGEVTETYYDGDFWWQCAIPAPGTGETLADMRDMPDGFERIAFIEEQNQPKAYRYLLSAFAEAELNVDGREVDALLEPFRDCQLDTLTVHNEDEDVWVFNATPAKVFPLNGTYESVRLTVDKTDGILREKRFDGPGGQYHMIAVSDVTLNPALPDSVFNFTPPQRYAVTLDSTDKLVESHRKQRARWEAQQSH